MTVLFVLILIGVSKKEGNGAAVEVGDKSVSVFGPCFFTFTLDILFICLISCLISSQVRDEYRTDYDPDILLRCMVRLKKKMLDFP